MPGALVGAIPPSPTLPASPFRPPAPASTGPPGAPRPPRIRYPTASASPCGAIARIRPSFGTPSFPWTSRRSSVAARQANSAWRSRGLSRHAGRNACAISTPTEGTSGGTGSQGTVSDRDFLRRPRNDPVTLRLDGRCTPPTRSTRPRRSSSRERLPSAGIGSDERGGIAPLGSSGTGQQRGCTRRLGGGGRAFPCPRGDDALTPAGRAIATRSGDGTSGSAIMPSRTRRRIDAPRQ